MRTIALLAAFGIAQLVAQPPRSWPGCADPYAEGCTTDNDCMGGYGPHQKPECSVWKCTHTGGIGDDSGECNPPCEEVSGTICHDDRDCRKPGCQLWQCITDTHAVGRCADFGGEDHPAAVVRPARLRASASLPIELPTQTQIRDVAADTITLVPLATTARAENDDTYHKTYCNGFPCSYSKQDCCPNNFCQHTGPTGDKGVCRSSPGPPPPEPSCRKLPFGGCSGSCGGAASCQTTSSGGCQCVQPTPPADSWKCVSGQCRNVFGGIDKGSCLAACEPSDEQYKCIDNQCQVVKQGGVAKSVCEAVCDKGASATMAFSFM